MAAVGVITYKQNLDELLDTGSTYHPPHQALNPDTAPTECTLPAQLTPNPNPQALNPDTKPTECTLPAQWTPKLDAGSNGWGESARTGRQYRSPSAATGQPPLQWAGSVMASGHILRTQERSCRLWFIASDVGECPLSSCLSAFINMQDARRISPSPIP